MNPSWVLKAKINEGKLDDFRAVAAKAVEATKKEAGCMAYEFYLNKDNTEVHIYEKYKDDAAILLHLNETFGPIAEEFMACETPISLEILGDVSEEVLKALAGLNPVCFHELNGFCHSK